MPINGVNNVSITLQLTLTSGATTLILPTGKGALLSGAVTPLRGVIEEYDASKVVVKREIVAITGISGDQLTISRAIEPCPISDSASVQQQVAQVFANPTSTKISVVMTKGMIDDINTSISTLGSAKLNASGEFRTGLIANRVIVTNGSGNETVLGGANGQVLGFGVGGAPVAISPTVDIAGLTAASDVGDADEYLQYNQVAGANRKVTGKTLRARSKNFGGTGADGAVNGTSNITITGTNSTYIVRNYSSWAAASGGPKTLTITPTNCILHIKIKGNADFTGWTFNLDGKGGQGSVGAQGTDQSQLSPSQAGKGIIASVLGVSTQPNWSTQGNKIPGYGGSSQLNGFSYPIAVTNQQIPVWISTSPEISIRDMALNGVISVACGSGGSGSRTNFNGYNTLGVGGPGGMGLIIEVNGNIIFGSLIINNRGLAGTPTTDGFDTIQSGAGGGGSVAVLGAGTISGTPTINITGGIATGGAISGRDGEAVILSLNDIS